MLGESKIQIYTEISQVYFFRMLSFAVWAILQLAMFLVGVGWLGARDTHQVDEWLVRHYSAVHHNPLPPTFRLHRGELQQRLDLKFWNGSGDPVIIYTYILQNW